MSKGIRPVNYTYGVGLEYVATTGKQVKDEIKSNLDGLSKLIKQYNEVLKVDPDADLSKLFNEIKRMQSLVNGINNSGNTFSDFVDKGVLDRVSKLENRLQSISTTSDVVKKDLAELKTSISLVTDTFKSVGQTKFPATFDNLFGDVKDQSEEIKKVATQIEGLKSSITGFNQLRKEIDKKHKGISTIGIDYNNDQISDLIMYYEDLKDELSNLSNLNFDDIIKKTQEIAGVTIKLCNALEETEDLSQFGVDGKYIKGLKDYINNISSTIDDLIAKTKQKQQELNNQLEKMQADQAKYVATISTSKSSGKSIGIQSDYTAQVTVNPKTNEREWTIKINDTIKNIEGQLSKVKLTPTFSKNASNMEKEIDGSLAQINHAINVDLKLTDNVKAFDEEIKRIDKSIQSAKRQLEANTTFKIKFEYEEGGRFKDAAYKIINQFKRIDSRFYIANGKKFISDVVSLKSKIDKELKEFKTELSIKNEDAILSNVNNIRTKIDEKIGNIGVSLTLKNAPQLMSQAKLMRDDIEEYYNKPVDNTDNETTDLSANVKWAQDQIDKIKTSLQSLIEMGLKSPNFLKLGAFDENFKYIKGSRDQIKQLLQEYENLVAKTTGSREEIFATYGRTKEGYNAYQQDLAMLEKAESALNAILQNQIQYQQHRLELAKNTLEQEKRITSTKKEQSAPKANDTDQIANNEKLSMSAEEATKKIRSLNGTITQYKLKLKDLEDNKFNASTFVRLGEWDKETQSFKNNSQYIKDLIKRYEELRNARIASGGKNAVGEEASLRGKLANILREQKKHISEIISKNQDELTSAREIAAAYKQVSEHKTRASKTKVNVDTTKLDNLNDKLKKAKETLELLKSKKIDAIGSTGLGDINKHLESLGSKQGFKELINFYNQLIAKKDELEKSGKAGSDEYIQLAKVYKAIEPQLNTIYQDQLKYTQSRISALETEIEQEKEILKLKTQQTQEENKQPKINSNKEPTTNTSISTTVQLDSTTLNTLAKDTTLKIISDKINNILSQLGKGIIINGSNISIEASNVSVTGKGTSSKNATKDAKKDPGEKEVKLSTISSYSQQLIAFEERIKRTGLYTDDLKQKFANLYAQLNDIKIQDDADEYKFDLDRFKENFEQLKTYDKLYQNLIESRTKQIKLNDQITTSNGPTAELQEQLKIQDDISKNIELQLNQYTTLYDKRAQQLAMEEAIKRANQEITTNMASQSDKDINKQNSELAKIVNDAQKQFDNMQYSIQNAQVPMADAITSKFKQYEQLLTGLKTKQQEILANPSLLKDQDYSQGLGTLLRQMKDVESKFVTLQKSSEKFISKVKSIDDIKLLGSEFKADNIEQLHKAMQEFADQAGKGAAKLLEFNDIERTATFEVQNGKGQIQQLTVAYDEATNALGRFNSKTKTSVSGVQQFFNSLKNSFQNVARYIASFGSVYRLFAMIKQGITYIREIDSALTELKKVTDETDATYQKFLKTMSNSAGVVGSTTAELTQSAADWARLGYSIEEAGELAKNTAILMNVSEFDNVNEATEALISSLQAFGYEASNSIEIVDKLNIVGNNFAISSDGIASGLQRSASTLVAAGNSLEQSIAMLAAGNKVIQDPEALGKSVAENKNSYIG